MSDFLATYLRYTEQQESPPAFHSWVALSVISATLRRKVWLDRSFMKLYPNIFVMIVGPPGQQKKSTAVAIGMKLLQEANVGVQIYAERMTGEGIMATMNRTNASTVTNTVKVESDFMVVGPEFIAMFGADQNQAGRMLSYMTRWYDCPDTFPYNTVAHGKIELMNVCPVMLCASSKQLLSVIPKEAEGGFLSRVIFVTSTERKRIPQPQKTADGPQLINMIQQISKMSGEFVIEPGALRMFDDWYMTIPESYDTRAAGFLERLPDHVLKTSCLLAASRGVMTIDSGILTTAMNMLNKVLNNMDPALAYVGTTDFSQLAYRLVEQIQLNGGTPKVYLYNTNAYLASVEQVDEALKDLTTRGIIKEMWKGSNVSYEIIPPTTP